MVQENYIEMWRINLETCLEALKTNVGNSPKEIVFWEICSNFWKIKIGLYIFHWIIYIITSYITYDSYIWIWYIHIWHTYIIYMTYLSHIYHTYYLSTYDIYVRHRDNPRFHRELKIICDRITTYSLGSIGGLIHASANGLVELHLGQCWEASTGKKGSCDCWAVESLL